MNLESSVRNIKGIGDKTAELFYKVGINNVNDLIHYYPRNYDKYEYIKGLNEIKPGERCAVYLTVKSNPKIVKGKRKSILSFYAGDENGIVEVRFFNSPYLLKAFKSGDKKVFRGFLHTYKEKVLLDQPKTYTFDEYSKLQNTITPIYPLTKDLSNEKVKASVKRALDDVSLNIDYLTEEECQDMNVLPMQDALEKIHFPKDEMQQYMARRRIVLEEFLQFIQISKEHEYENAKIENQYKMIEVADCKRLIDALPYELTNAQKKAFDDISSDLCGDYLMNRLVQGDVGSGKTIVSILALLMCAANGFQGALMAPTEVLARQHYETVKKMTDTYKLCFKPVLLTGKMSAKDRKEALSGIQNGENNLVIGTHALIQEGVEFKNLALVVTDEQHRFGVKQREALKNKGSDPHLMVMSATPIPRTLAMIVFAGLSVSVIDELPKNRIPIANCVVDSSFRIKAYEKIRSELNKGHQAYVICPMVDENEEDTLMLKSVEEYSLEIQDYFGDLFRVGKLTGKMKPDEKTRIMDSFKNKDIDILVATTVVEVGIDVPNATVILIENADRFGLSQLHQLRGRVGRGDSPSYCILMSDSKNDGTQKRLKVLNETNDGFEIARQDMKLRGPGELNGVRQSGELQFGIADMVEDSDILMLASQIYDKISNRMNKDNINLIDFRTI